MEAIALPSVTSRPDNLQEADLEVAESSCAALTYVLADRSRVFSGCSSCRGGSVEGAVAQSKAKARKLYRTRLTFSAIAARRAACLG